MRQALMITLSATALALAGCGSKPSADTTSTNTDTSTVAVTNTTMDTGAMGGGTMGNATAPVASQGQMFANTAAASDAFEIATSQLAQTSAKSDAVEKFAAKMIEAHTGSTAKLKTAAASASPAITPDPTMTVEQQKTLADLKTMSGADFDAAYAKAQVNGHQMTLDALKAYAASGDVPQLKSFANTLVPTVTAHLNMAKGLKG